MKYINRSKEVEIKSHILQKEITVILGPRQVGKTTMIRKIMRELELANHRMILYNLDIDTDLEIFESQNSVVQALALEFGQEPAIIFVDEIQRIKNAGLFLKGIYDRMLPYKFVVTGSGSLEIREKIIESLAGRKRVFELYPLSFEEFFHYKTDNKYINKYIAAASVHTQLIKNILDEYLVFGGFPKVVLAPTISEKKKELQEIFLSYMDRDISTLAAIDNPMAYSKMIRVLSHRIGTFINYSNLSKLCNVSAPSIKKYIWYVEKTFMMHFVLPFYTNPGKELTKSPTNYFVDLGMLSYASRDFEPQKNRSQMGMVFQNFVFLLLKEYCSKCFYELKTWRTKDKAEVDFVIDMGKIKIPVEVKYTDYKKQSIPSSLKSFIKKYKPTTAYIININAASEILYLDCKINIIPFWKFYHIKK